MLPAPAGYRPRRLAIPASRHMITARLAITKALEACRPSLSSTRPFFFFELVVAARENRRSLSPAAQLRPSRLRPQFPLHELQHLSLVLLPPDAVPFPRVDHPLEILVRPLQRAYQ